MQGQSQSIVPGLELFEVLDDRRNEVWRARRVGGGADVAVKLLKPAHEALLPRRFGSKHRTLARIVAKNPGWVPPLEHGVAGDGRSYVVHPFFSNLSLADQLDYGPTPWFPAAKLIAQVAQVLASAHLEGWTFGHLRPSNIVLDDFSEPSVTVYGTSTRRFDDGSPEFTAPEMQRGEALTPASDVYSLALLLASLILGRAVGHESRPSEVLQALDGHAPRRILEIIDYGLSANRLNRFANASKMARALWIALAEPDELDTPRTGISSDRHLSNDHLLSALMAGPLVEGDESAPPGGEASEKADGISDADRPPDSDDPTDPTFDSPDPFGAPAPLDEPTSPPFQVSIAGPLSELLGRPADSGGDVTSNNGGRDNEDHSHRRSAALTADPLSRLGPRLRDVLTDRLSHLIAVARRHGATSAPLVGVTAIAALAAFLGLGQLRAGGSTAGDGAPGRPSSTVAAAPGDRPSSPLNDQAPLDGARSLSHAEATADRAERSERVVAVRTTTVVATRTKPTDSLVAIGAEPAETDDTTSPSAGSQPGNQDDGEADGPAGTVGDGSTTVPSPTTTASERSTTTATTDSSIPTTTSTTEQASTSESPRSTRRRWWTRPPQDDDGD